MELDYLFIIEIIALIWYDGNMKKKNATVFLTIKRKYYFPLLES